MFLSPSDIIVVGADENVRFTRVNAQNYVMCERIYRLNVKITSLQLYRDRFWFPKSRQLRLYPRPPCPRLL